MVPVGSGALSAPPTAGYDRFQVSSCADEFWVRAHDAIPPVKLG
jgi:hypothetical protein